MTPERYRELIEGFRGKRILVIGDVMLDRFIWGSVSRISPEAPVPVVQVRKESIYPGGAANVARNLVPFAGEVQMAGVVGDDEQGKTLLRVLKESGIETDGMLCDDGYQTTTKTRIIARQQQVVRFDHELIAETGREQVEEVARFVEAKVGELDGVIIEDYGKGFVNQMAVDRLVPIMGDAGVVVTVDPAASNSLHWDGVTAIKPNRQEAYRMAGVEPGDGTDDPSQDADLLEVGSILLELWGTEILQITLGEQGMMLFERGKETYHIPTKAQDVFDVSGAGDTAISLFTLALTAGADAREAAEISNYASGVVVGKLGTATLTVEELLDSIDREAR